MNKKIVCENINDIHKTKFANNSEKEVGVIESLLMGKVRIIIRSRWHNNFVRKESLINSTLEETLRFVETGKKLKIFNSYKVMDSKTVEIIFSEAGYLFGLNYLTPVEKKRNSIFIKKYSEFEKSWGF